MLKSTLKHSGSSVDFKSGRNRPILIQQFHKAKEELSHPRPIDYEVKIIDDF